MVTSFTCHLRARIVGAEEHRSGRAWVRDDPIWRRPSCAHGGTRSRSSEHVPLRAQFAGRRTSCRRVDGVVATAWPRRRKRALRRALELPLLPCFEPGVVVEAREDPPEHAQPWLPAPAVGVAVARQEADGLPRLAHEREDEVPDDERRRDPSHVKTLPRQSQLRVQIEEARPDHQGHVEAARAGSRPSQRASRRAGTRSRSPSPHPG